MPTAGSHAVRDLASQAAAGRRLGARTPDRRGGEALEGGGRRECEAKDGKVAHKPSGRDSAALARSRPTPPRSQLGHGAGDQAARANSSSSASRWRGSTCRSRSTARRNSASTPGARHGLCRGLACPVPGGKLKSVDDAEIKGRARHPAVVKLDDAVAVVADRFWRAKKALEASPSSGISAPAPAPTASSSTQAYRDGARRRADAIARNDGDVDTALQGAAR